MASSVFVLRQRTAHHLDEVSDTAPHLNDLRRLLARGTLITTEPTDYEEAAALYRVCRRDGATVRTMIDCLIASIAIRSGSPLSHADSDFDVLARHTPLELDRFRA